MRGFHFGLTGHGLVILVFGDFIAMGTSLTGKPDLAWVGVFVIYLPVVGLVIVLALSPRLICERSVAPDSLSAGGMTWMRLSVMSNRATSFSALSFRDRLPDALGRDTTPKLIRGLGRWRQAAGYDVATRQRGYFQIDPLGVCSLDAFEVAWRSWQATGNTTSLRVAPRLRALSLPGGGRTSGANGDAIPQRIGNMGTDDVLVCEHRHGDGMRRAHWEIGTKCGELTVRLEEQPWSSAMTIIVNTRVVAHIDSGPESTLKWVLSLGASLVTELLRDRLRVSLLDADGVTFRPIDRRSVGAAARLLAIVTDVEPSGHAFLEDCLTGPDTLGTTQAVATGLGLLHSRDAAAPTTVTARMTDIGALIPDARTPRLPADVVVVHKRTYRLLTASGWNVATFGPEATAPQGWDRLIAQREIQ